MAADPELTIPEQAHYLGHQDALKPSLRCGKPRLLGPFPGRQSDRPLPPRSAAVGLGGIADLPAAYLSAGQRRRLSIARLIAVKRPIWLLDEPTSALDREAQAMLAELMRQHLPAAG